MITNKYYILSSTDGNLPKILPLTIERELFNARSNGDGSKIIVKIDGEIEIPELLHTYGYFDHDQITEILKEEAWRDDFFE